MAMMSYDDKKLMFDLFALQARGDKTVGDRILIADTRGGGCLVSNVPDAVDA